MIFLIIAILIIPLSYYFYRGYKNTHDIVINHIDIDNNDSSASSNVSSFRILQLSDMHLENISITPEQLYKQLKDYPIDLIALTGDFLDRKRSIPRLVPYLEVLKKLNPMYGTYAVFGNHDYVLRDANFIQLNELLMEYGIKTMKNENETIDVNGTAVNIIGIDDFSTNRSDIAKSYKGLEKGHNLVLTHDPNIVLAMDDHFDYLLSGHFHGGQICWPKPYHLLKMGKLVRMNMIKGLQHHNGRPFYINEGLGQTGVNIRVGSRPEITFHNWNLHQGVEENGREEMDKTLKVG